MNDNLDHATSSNSGLQLLIGRQSHKLACWKQEPVDSPITSTVLKKDTMTKWLSPSGSDLTCYEVIWGVGPSTEQKRCPSSLH